MPRPRTLIARLLETAVPGRVVRAAPLRWSVSPDNMPYAIHAGVHPEQIPTDEVIVGQLLRGSPSLPPRETVRARCTDGEWLLEPAADDDG